MRHITTNPEGPVQITLDAKIIPIPKTPKCQILSPVARRGQNICRYICRYDDNKPLAN